MQDEDWAVGYARSLAVFLNGNAITATGPRGEPIEDDSFLMMFNAHHDPITFVIPEPMGGSSWTVEIDTATDSDRGANVSANDKWEIAPWAVVVLRRLDTGDQQ
jgi:glycogen operon protein